MDIIGRTAKGKGVIREGQEEERKRNTGKDKEGRVNSKRWEEKEEGTEEEHIREDNNGKKWNLEGHGKEKEGKSRNG